MIPVKTKHIKKYAPPFPAASPASPALPRPAIAGAALGQATSRSRLAKALTSPGRGLPLRYRAKADPGRFQMNSAMTSMHLLCHSINFPKLSTNGNPGR